MGDDVSVGQGLGVFETVLVCRGHLVRWSKHRARLEAGLARLGSTLDGEQLAQAATQAVAVSTVGDVEWQRLRVTAWVAADGAPAALEVTVTPYRPVSGDVSVVTLPWRRSSNHPLAGMKSTSYAEHVVGLRYAQAQGASEGLWLNQREHVMEGTFTNVWWARGEVLYTPSVASGCLGGVARAWLIEEAARRGVAVHQVDVELEGVLDADEVFVTNALRGVQRVQQLDRRGYDADVVTSRLRQWWLHSLPQDGSHVAG